MLRLHRLAEVEIRDAVRWYCAESIPLALRFHQAVLDTLVSVESEPLRYAVLETLNNETHLRRARVHGFPYVVIFELIDSDAFVFAVAHTSRRPGYWRRRKSS